MNPKFRVFLLRTASALLKLLYAVILVLTCAFTSVWLCSPIVLAYLVVLNKLGKAVALLSGDFLNIWLVASAILFVPILIYSIVYRIKQKLTLNVKLKQAMEKPKEEKVKESK